MIGKIKQGKKRKLENWLNSFNYQNRQEALKSLKHEKAIQETWWLFGLGANAYYACYMAGNGNLAGSSKNSKTAIDQKHQRLLKECVAKYYSPKLVTDLQIE